MKFTRGFRWVSGVLVVLVFSSLAAPAQAIIAGQTAQLGELPSVVALGDRAIFHNEGNLTNATFCGGVLIGQRLVLTAAHCVVDFNNTTKQPRISLPAELVVGGGVTALNAMKNAQVANVLRVDISTDYLISLITSNGNNTVDDLALLQLDATIPGTQPASLATAEQVAAVEKSPTNLVTAGWGDLDAKARGNYINELMRTYVTSVNDGLCADSNATFSVSSPDGLTTRTFHGINPADAQYFDASTMLCGIGVTNAGDITDTCLGDSGGPALATIDGRPTVIGITSWGPILKPQSCALDEPSVYANAASARDLIDLYQAPQPRVVTTPTSFTITQNRWDYNLGAWTFRVIDGTNTIGSCTAMPDAVSGVATCTVDGLTPKAYYKVETEPSTGRSSWAGRLILAQVQPTRPTNVKVIGSVSKKVITKKLARISVLLSASANRALITRYAVTCVSGALKTTGTHPTSSVIINNLVRGKTYTCSATATNEMGTSLPRKFVVVA